MEAKQAEHRNLINLLNRIRSLDDLTDPIVNRLRVTSNLSAPLPILNFTVSPMEFSMFLFRALRLPPITYDSSVRRIILYPQLSKVQHALIRIYHKWLYEVSKRMQKFTNKTYERMRDVHLGLGPPYKDSYYFTHLALREVGAKHATIIFEMGHGVRNGHGQDGFGNDYINEKVARWIEGSNGSVRLVIVILITEDPLPSPQSFSPTASMSGSSHSSNCLYWGLARDQILALPTAALAHHIMREDIISHSRTKIDIYYATQSYPSHRGYSEHVWHGAFTSDGCMCTDDDDDDDDDDDGNQFYASSFKLSNLLPRTVKLKDGGAGGDEDVRIPVDEFALFLPQVIRENRMARAELLAHRTQQGLRITRI